MRGLPDNATEEDVSDSAAIFSFCFRSHILKKKIAKRLGEMNACIEEVSLIKSRETGESRKFAFVRFTSVGHAMQFVEKHRTFHMKDFRVRVDYSHKNNGSLEKEEWRCATVGNDCHSFTFLTLYASVESLMIFIAECASNASNRIFVNTHLFLLKRLNN